MMRFTAAARWWAAAGLHAARVVACLAALDAVLNPSPRTPLALLLMLWSFRQIGRLLERLDRADDPARAARPVLVDDQPEHHAHLNTLALRGLAAHAARHAPTVAPAPYLLRRDPGFHYYRSRRGRVVVCDHCQTVVHLETDQETS